MPNTITYRSFCWGLGTTSFRTRSFNKTIEQQLDLLDIFWSKNENSGQTWIANDELQTSYYLFMQSKGFVDGDAPRKAKDAREKTSGLVDVGLIDNERRLTEAGKALLAISRSGDFSSDNALQIPSDSYIYLKQLLKTEISELHVRPFVVLLYVLSRVRYLTIEEFTYLLPLCMNPVSTEDIVNGILQMREGNSNYSVNSIILNRLMGMDNYQLALSIFLESTVTEDLICDIGINRKSRQYDKPYFLLYQKLHNAFVDMNSAAFVEVYEATRKINIGQAWRQYLFDTVSRNQISDAPLDHLNNTEFSRVRSEAEFKTAFFRVMHLLKARATLHDYCDLNRRYFRTTDTVLFADNHVKLDIVPKHYFDGIIVTLYQLAYTSDPHLTDNCPIETISPCLAINEDTLMQGVNDELGVHISTIEDLQLVLEDERYRRLSALIDEKFSDAQLVRLLDYFESRNDREIREMVTDDADIPTIFEYVLGILWYKVSECTGKVLNYMKLSLDADLLPKTHAAGGEADIVYEYAATESYPAHTLLIEATLADGTNQRRMEMEPVSRHLGRYLLRTGNLHSYCIFVSPYLDLNVLSDFCSRKRTFFYAPTAEADLDEPTWLRGMTIVPLRTGDIKALIEKHITYSRLYPDLSMGYDEYDKPPHRWYKELIDGILRED